jgi:hypothetical protein
MIRLKARSAIHALSLFGLLAGLAAAETARADDSTVIGCRAEGQGTELVTDCDDKTQQAELEVPATIPPPTTPPEIIYLKVPGEGGKGDHDRDRGNGGGDGGGGAAGDGRKI